MTSSVSTTQPTTTARSHRVPAALASGLLGVGLFVTVAAVNVPHKPTDAALLAWWQDTGNRTSGLVSGLAAILVAVTVPIVVNHLRSRALASAWMAYAVSVGAAMSAVWLVTGAVRASIQHLVDVMDEPLPSVDVLRFATAVNYTLLGLCGMAMAGLLAIAVSIAVLRTGVLAPWVAYVGLACGGLILVAVLAQYGAYTTPLAILWAFCLAAAIWRQPAPA